MKEPNEKYDVALKTRFWAHDIDKVITLRDYLAELLTTLIWEGEGFSGKRPFGNSGWEDFAAGPLIKAKVIAGTITGRLDRSDHEVDGYAAAVMRDEIVKVIYYALEQG